ncbi:MAG: DHH family phosphoesterase [Deltaproteobacteria bacterium]|nr:DHH family phosphoesterase [Deltaproteobacteria bacterium]
MEQIIHKLKKSKRAFIASHTNPDGDAIGSLVAMGLSLAAMGKDIVLFNESPIPAVYRFLSGVDRVVNRVRAGCAFDTAVILDCGDLHRVGEAVPIVEKIPVVINIDHHVTNTRFGNVHLIDPDACATAEILYRLLPGLGAPLSLDIANAIYTGILTDTGSFRFSNTNRSAFEICEKMVARGVDPYRIAQQVYGTYSLGRIKLLNLALDSIEVSQNGKLSMMVVTQQMMQDTGARPEDTDGLINYAKGIKDIKVAVFIEELNHGTGQTAGRLPYHVSLRSDGSVDVAAIAAAFGGGGHSSAAGFSIESTLPEIKTQILGLAEEM